MTPARRSRDGPTISSAHGNDTGSNTGFTDSRPDLELDPLGSFVVIKPTDDKASFGQINLFWPQKYLQSICGTRNLEIESTANGSFIIKANSQAQTKALLKTTTFCEKSVTVSLHFVKNTKKGMIFVPEMKHMTEADLLDGLKTEGVTHDRRLTSFKNGEKHATNILVLTFNSIR